MIIRENQEVIAIRIIKQISIPKQQLDKDNYVNNDKKGKDFETN